MDKSFATTGLLVSQGRWGMLTSMVLAAVAVFLFLFLPEATAAVETDAPYPGHSQLSHFPKPLDLYSHGEGASAWAMIKERASQQPFNVVATLIFVLAVAHTFVASIFREWSHDLEKRHLKKYGPDTDRVSFWAVTLHFFGEVEAVFGLWIAALGAAALLFHGWADFKNYIGHDVNWFVLAATAFTIRSAPTSRGSSYSTGMPAFAALTKSGWM